jgi:hypothetical protein
MSVTLALMGRTPWGVRHLVSYRHGNAGIVHPPVEALRSGSLKVWDVSKGKGSYAT